MLHASSKISLGHNVQSSCIINKKNSKSIVAREVAEVGAMGNLGALIHSIKSC